MTKTDPTISTYTPRSNEREILILCKILETSHCKETVYWLRNAIPNPYSTHPCLWKFSTIMGMFPNDTSPAKGCYEALD